MLLQDCIVVIKAANREVARLLLVQAWDTDALTPSTFEWRPYRYQLLSIPYELLVSLCMRLDNTTSSAIDDS